MCRRPAPFIALLAVLTATGCGGHSASTVHLRPDQRAVPIGAGPGYRIAAISAAVAKRRPVAGLRCLTASSQRRTYGVHLELFAHRRVVPVPAGVGVAPPQRRRGAYVLGGACAYPLRTLEPTGVVRVSTPPGAAAPTLGRLFAIWGQPLSDTRLAGFRGRVLAFLDGRPWTAATGSIPLRRHAEIVLEVGGRIPPHPSYRFPPGL